jgi:hypothetical protein
MKPLTPILVLGLIVAAFLAGLFYRQLKPVYSPQQLTLEQIISIRELHLVNHTYHDLFFLHRNNDVRKPIRAMVQMPVTITAYLNLKEVEMEYHGDTLRKIILPAAVLKDPIYHTNQLTVRETRGFQLHAGKDLYPGVTTMMSKVINARMDTARNLALSNHILIQAEAEGKEYLESLLRTMGHPNVIVTFREEAKDKEVTAYLQAQSKNTFRNTSRPTRENAEKILSLGFLPLTE